MLGTYYQIPETSSKIVSNEETLSLLENSIKLTCTLNLVHGDALTLKVKKDKDQNAA